MYIYIYIERERERMRERRYKNESFYSFFQTQSLTFGSLFPIVEYIT